MAIDREKVLAAAQKFVEKKRYDRAAVEYQRILQEDPNDARILLKLGDLQSKMEAYPDAIATYERVGKHYASQGFALKAIAVFKQIREIISKHAPQLDERYAHIGPKLAELYQQLGLVSDALAALDEVATRLQRQNRDAEAVDVFRKLVELDPTNPLPHLRLAEALSRGKDIDGAVAEFGIASGQLVKLGRREDALKVIDRLLQHKPEPTYARGAAEILLDRGTPTDGMLALAKLQLSFQANPRDLDTLALLARAFTQIGQGAKAIEVQKEMARIARDGGQMDLFGQLVTTLLKLAPTDEGVLQLASGGLPTSTAPPPGAQGQTDVEGVDAYEDIADTEIESEAQPGQSARPGSRDGVSFVETNVEVVEVGGETSAREREQIARVLSEAAGYRRARQQTRAVETLRQGLETAPKAIEIHEMLRDVLLDAGQTEEAVVEMIRLAELLVETLDGESAARSLQDALSLDPDNALASRMLSDLGYELVEESEAPAEPAAEEGFARTRTASQDPDAPLPSYDLEEIGPDDVTVRSQLESRLDADTQVGRNPLEIDDPFGEGATAARRQASSSAGVPELEGALEEADFFASRGLYDDARAIIEEQLGRLPNHPLLRDRLSELDALQRSERGESGTRKSPSFAADDIAESLNSLEIQRGQTGAPPTAQIDVEQVFAQFKAGVASQIEVDDAQSHYDLGVAYKEMGLLDDAVREFGVASRDVKRACVCLSMIGTIEIERGRVNEAIEAFSKGLETSERTKDQEATLNYELGSAYEAKKIVKQAIDHFQRVARISPNFRDVQERIRRLQRADARPPASRAAAVGADDEFDRAFEDAFRDKLS